MLRAIKIKLYLNTEQIYYVNNLLGCSRFIYNNILSYSITEYKNNEKTLSFSDQGKKLVELKSEYNWLKNVHSKVLQQSIIDLNKAFKGFFKHGNGFPNFKKKNNEESCRFPIDAISDVNGNRINIIKQLKDIHYKCSKRDEKLLNKYKKQIKSVTLTKTKSDKINLSILIDLPEDVIRKSDTIKGDGIIGIDLGIKDFVITSDGEVFENIKTKRNNQKKLNKLHKKLSRKKKGSNNRKKAKIKLAKKYEKLNNKKENYLHEVSNKLLNENQVIIMEDLNVSGMMKNHKLARSIQELSLSKFKNILEYKAEWENRLVIKVDRFFPSSKTCSCCGWKNNDLKLSDREFICQECGIVIDRDLNAAINIKQEGIRLLKLMIENGEINNKTINSTKIKELLGLSSPELTPLESLTLVCSLN